MCLATTAGTTPIGTTRTTITTIRRTVLRGLVGVLVPVAEARIMQVIVRRINPDTAPLTMVIVPRFRIVSRA